MFIRGGYNVYPLEVEAVLADHPAVAAVAVVPRPDDVMGEIGVAVVVPVDPAVASEPRRPAFVRGGVAGGLQDARGDPRRRAATGQRDRQTRPSGPGRRRA